MTRLPDPVLLAGVSLASFVEFGLAELGARIGAHVMRDVADFEADRNRAGGSIIAVGDEAIAAAGFSPAVVDDLGAEGYAIDLVDGRVGHGIAVRGGDDQGLKYALLDLMRSLRREGDAWVLPDGFARRTRPAFELRAMYAHLHWSYKRPYALRSWTLDDWMRYVDLLSHFGANTLQIWPMLGLMPVPLSEGDTSYLKMLAEVVRYALEARGMQVWIGECANNLAGTDHGQPMSEREYFGTERLVDPGTEEGMAEIIASREAMFRLVPEANGHWIIDSDPGQWPGSPASEFVDVVVENQRLARAHNPDIRTIYWMHFGWDTGERQENLDAILAGLAERLDEPWSVLLGAIPEHIPAAEAAGALDRVVWFPYGWIEGEPTPPVTQFSFDLIDTYLEQALHLGIARAMGQAQTPIVQLPKLWYLFRCLWEPELRREDASGRIAELAALLYPESGDVVAAAWEAMRGSDVAALAEARASLTTALDDGLGDPGVLGALLFGDPALVVRDLLAQLVIRHEAEAFRAAVFDQRSTAEVQGHFTNYLRAALRWREHHGYVPMGGFKYLYGPYLEPVLEGWNRYYDDHGWSHAFPEVQWIPKAKILGEGEFHWAMVDGLLTEVVGGPRTRKL